MGRKSPGNRLVLRTTPERLWVDLFPQGIAKFSIIISRSIGRLRTAGFHNNIVWFWSPEPTFWEISALQPNSVNTLYESLASILVFTFTAAEPDRLGRLVVVMGRFPVIVWYVSTTPPTIERSQNRPTLSPIMGPPPLGNKTQRH